MKRLTLVLAVTGAMALAAHAQAADLRPTFKASSAPANPAYDWSGFYAGIHAGSSWADNEFFDVNGGFDAAVFTARGVFGGGQIGFNWQAGPWVLGAELEGTLSHLQRGVFGQFCGGFQNFGCFPSQCGGFQNFGCFPSQCGGFQNFGCFGQLGARVQELGLLSGRLGYAWDRWLVYVKGGGAVSHDKYVINVPGVFAATPTDSRLGWMAGVGIEYGLDSNWSVKLEYNYIDLGTEQLTFNAPGGLTLIFDQEQQVHLVKVGINYRFAPAGRTN